MRVNTFQSSALMACVLMTACATAPSLLNPNNPFGLVGNANPGEYASVIALAAQDPLYSGTWTEIDKNRNPVGVIAFSSDAQMRLAKITDASFLRAETARYSRTQLTKARDAFTARRASSPTLEPKNIGWSEDPSWQAVVVSSIILTSSAAESEIGGCLLLPFSAGLAGVPIHDMRECDIDARGITFRGKKQSLKRALQLLQAHI